MVVTDELEGDDSFFTLYEIWSPGRDVPIRSGLVGIWTADSDFHGREVQNSWLIATTRLRLYPKPKYERRSDLTGVHFIVDSINVGHTSAPMPCPVYFFCYKPLKNRNKVIFLIPIMMHLKSRPTC